MLCLFDKNGESLAQKYVGIGSISKKLACRTHIIQADGDELEKIFRDFDTENFPQRLNKHARVVSWVGETAQFIAANWS